MKLIVDKPHVRRRRERDFPALRTASRPADSADCRRRQISTGGPDGRLGRAPGYRQRCLEARAELRKVRIRWGADSLQNARNRRGICCRLPRRHIVAMPNAPLTLGYGGASSAPPYFRAPCARVQVQGKGKGLALDWGYQGRRTRAIHLPGWTALQPPHGEAMGGRGAGWPRAAG